jgi:hypothetical protein
VASLTSLLASQAAPHVAGSQELALALSQAHPLQRDGFLTCFAALGPRLEPRSKDTWLSKKVFRNGTLTMAKFKHTTMIKRMEGMAMVHPNKGTFFSLVWPEHEREVSQSR